MSHNDICVDDYVEHDSQDGVDDFIKVFVIHNPIKITRK